MKFGHNLIMMSIDGGIQKTNEVSDWSKRFMFQQIVKKVFSIVK